LKHISDKYPAAKPVYDWYITHQKGYFIDWKGSEHLQSTLGAIMHATAIRNDQNTLSGRFGKSGVDTVAGLTVEQQKEILKHGYSKFLGSENAGEIPGEPKTFRDKVPAAIFLQNLMLSGDCITMCRWANCPPFYSRYTPDYLGDISQGARVYSAVTGIDLNSDEMAAAMDPIVNIERCIHVREGRSREHDIYNDTFFKLKAWEWTNKAEFSRVMDEYYKLRGWDIITGIPNRSTLKKQGLGRIAAELETRYGVSVPE